MFSYKASELSRDANSQALAPPLTDLKLVRSQRAQTRLADQLVFHHF